MVSAPETSDDKIPWTKFLKENWLWITSLIYVYLCIVGMLDSWKRFDAFGIRIFEFSEPTDFIVAAVREPHLIIVLVLFTIMGLSMLPSLGLFEFIGIPPALARRLPTPNRQRRRRFKVSGGVYFCAWLIVLCLSAYGATFFWNDDYGEVWKRNLLNDLDRQVEVVFLQQGGNPGALVVSQPVVFIGSNSKYLFLYCEITRGFIVLPSHNVVQMRRLDTLPSLTRRSPPATDTC